MTKIHWAAELRIARSQLIRNEHDSVVFIEDEKPAPQWTGFSFTLSPSGLASHPTFCLQGLCLLSSFARRPIA